MAEAPESVGLPDLDATILAEVLVHDPRIVLPPHLVRRTASDGTVEPVEVSHEKKREYILQLLRHDAGVFLERHGKLLSLQNLRPFDLLKDNYEVNFYLRLLRSDAAASKSQRAKIRNRRLAYYNINSGKEFFSMEAMKDRDPLQWQYYIGRYSQRPERLPLTNGKVYENILRQHDNTNFNRRVRAAHEQEARRAEMEEEEEESDEEEDLGSGEAQAPIAAETGLQRGNAGVMNPPSEGREPCETRSGMQVFGGVDQLPGDYGPMCATEEEQAELKEEFVQHMLQRFLNGNDREHFDYDTVDNDQGLDEFWAKSASRDQEEAYFDAD